MDKRKVHVLPNISYSVQYNTALKYKYNNITYEIKTILLQKYPEIQTKSVVYVVTLAARLSAGTLLMTGASGFFCMSMTERLWA